MLVAASLVRPECNHGSAGTEKRKRGGDKKGGKKNSQEAGVLLLHVGISRPWKKLR